jgi:hypothetical protein
MGTIGVKLVMTKVFHIYPETNAAEGQPDGTENPTYDWSAEYPFSGDYGFTYTAPTDEIKEKPVRVSPIKSFENSVRAIEGNVDYYTSNLLLGRMKFVELNAAFNKLVGMNIVSGTDSVVVMRNGYLTFEALPVNTDYAVQSTAYFAQTLKEKGINFLYVQCPSKENPDDNQLPHGIEDNYNINADSLIKGLSERNVPYIDLRENLNSEFDNYYSCFFKTDHHWTPETGVWASGKIADKLNNEYSLGISTAIGNLDNYKVDVFEKYCFGSQGKKATLRFADPEDISLIYPKADTDFTVTYDNNAPLSGRFEDTLLRKDVFDKIDYYNISTYSAYLHGNHAMTTIHNSKVDNGRKMLYIMDSFSASVVPYLATEIEDIVVLDLRTFNGSVMSVIEQFCPDTVVVAYNPSTFSETRTHNGTFNFE